MPLLAWWAGRGRRPPRATPAADVLCTQVVLVSGADARWARTTRWGRSPPRPRRPGRPVTTECWPDRTPSRWSGSASGTPPSRTSAPAWPARSRRVPPAPTAAGACVERWRRLAETPSARGADDELHPPPYRAGLHLRGISHRESRSPEDTFERLSGRLRTPPHPGQPPTTQRPRSAADLTHPVLDTPSPGHQYFTAAARRGHTVTGVDAARPDDSLPGPGNGDGTDPFGRQGCVGPDPRQSGHP